jgi:hypothetical protein
MKRNQASPRLGLKSSVHFCLLDLVSNKERKKSVVCPFAIASFLDLDLSKMITVTGLPGPKK